jgi:hypothetical protein
MRLLLRQHTGIGGKLSTPFLALLRGPFARTFDGCSPKTDKDGESMDRKLLLVYVGLSFLLWDRQMDRWRGGVTYR